MDTPEKEKELLLGFLLNALEDQEVADVKRELSRQPRLRFELAMLQRDLSPLNYIADSVDPPPYLAEKTCKKLWENLDNESIVNEKHTEKYTEKYTKEFNLDKTPVTQDSVLGCVVDPFKTFVDMPAVSKKEAEAHFGKAEKTGKEKGTEKTLPFWSSHWLGLAASAFVGIVLAFFLFPMLRFAERSTISYVTDNWKTEINRKIDQYEQIYSQPDVIPLAAELLPFNLAQSSWQELHYGTPANTPVLHFVPARSFEELIVLSEKELQTDSETSPMNALNPEISDWNTPIPADISRYSDYTILVLPGQENVIRSAFGQDILIKGGRVFFRILPGTETLNE